MMSVLEVDVGTWPENANVSLRQTGDLYARPGTHGLDRKFPEPKVDFGVCKPLIRLGEYEIHVHFGVFCVFFVQFSLSHLAKMN